MIPLGAQKTHVALISTNPKKRERASSSLFNLTSSGAADSAIGAVKAALAVPLCDSVDSSAASVGAASAATMLLRDLRGVDPDAVVDERPCLGVLLLLAPGDFLRSTTGDDAAAASGAEDEEDAVAARLFSGLFDGVDRCKSSAMADRTIASSSPVVWAVVWRVGVPKGTPLADDLDLGELNISVKGQYCNELGIGAFLVVYDW